MKDIAQCTGHAQLTLPRQSTPPLMRKNLRRGRLRLCRTMAPRIAYSTQSMVGRHTVTETCTDKGRFRANRPFLDWDDAFSSIPQAQLPPALRSRSRSHFVMQS